MTMLRPDTGLFLRVALDDLEPVHVEVGYGNLGIRGVLGYDGGDVCVGGRRFSSAISAHPPARVRFTVPSGAGRFTCRVAINDDVAAHGSHATFTVLADGRVVAEVARVPAGGAPIDLAADVRGASSLELVTTTSAWAYSHAVWLDPTLSTIEAGGNVAPAATITDPLQRADLFPPIGMAPVARCIATVASAGFEGWVDDLLASARANGRCDDAAFVVFNMDGSPGVDAVAEQHGATVVRCHPRRTLDPTAKAVLYSAGSLIPAERFLCLDADMLVLDDLGPVFAAIDACPPLTMLVCGEGNDHGLPDLRTALDLAYGGGPDPPFFARNGELGGHPLVVNDGLLAGSRAAFLALEERVRTLPGVLRWVDERADIRWRNQFAVNVALALGSTVELDPTWNIQLHVQQVDTDGGRCRWRGRDVRVLHFSGAGKSQYGTFRDVTRVGSRMAALASQGQFEAAIAIGRQLEEHGPLHPRAAERLSALAASMAPPATGSTNVVERSWSSAIPQQLLLQMQQGLHHQRYRGRQFVKSPFDQAMYTQLLERERPRTIVEIGSKAGGSALWFADLARSLGLDCSVHSYDIVPVTDVADPAVEFHLGDGRRLTRAISGAELAGWPHPWLIIDDADHAEQTSRAILDFFHDHLHDGDIVVVEDGNLSDLYPQTFPGYSSGPHLALRRFMECQGDAYEIDASLCDLFGHNTTTASNGILRRRSSPPLVPPEPAATDLLVGQPWRDLVLPDDVLAVPTMLSVRERQVLAWLARHHVRGEGRIVDGGCFLGGSTAALAWGLAARTDGPWDGTIASYDLFRVEEYTLGSFAADLPDRTIGASFRPAFDANTARWTRFVDVCEGDACAIGWTGEPIEVLFLDMVKTWELNDLVLAQFLPCLVPGHSIIVQQDYLWGYGAWIHMTMELLDGCVRRLDAMPNGSVVYQLVAPVPTELIGARLRDDLAPQRMYELMDRAVSRWDGEDRGMVELARAMLIGELDGPECALDELDAVVARHSQSPRVSQCAAIVRSYLTA